mmetsp:Transcript_25585/g.38088  ORF Transcript_25585/g.38088 Transcript_25585/m.38088 type:complete len:218 (+) Transcript_25585:1842-2495(+)
MTTQMREWPMKIIPAAQRRMILQASHLRETAEMAMTGIGRKDEMRSKMAVQTNLSSTMKYQIHSVVPGTLKSFGTNALILYRMTPRERRRPMFPRNRQMRRRTSKKMDSLSIQWKANKIVVKFWALLRKNRQCNSMRQMMMMLSLKIIKKTRPTWTPTPKKNVHNNKIHHDQTEKTTQNQNRAMLKKKKWRTPQKYLKWTPMRKRKKMSKKMRAMRL